MATTVAQGLATVPVKLTPGTRKAYAGTLTGTSTLTPQLSFDNKATWVSVASPIDLTAVAHTATFPALSIEAPDEQEVWFRVANTSGTGSWAVEGLPGPAA